jgi:hypothetical protein
VSALPPGDYHVRLAVMDTIAGKSYKRDAMIHIVQKN